MEGTAQPNDVVNPPLLPTEVVRGSFPNEVVEVI